MRGVVDVTVIDSREEFQEVVVLSLLLGGGFHVLDDVVERISREVRCGRRGQGEEAGARGELRVGREGVCGLE